MRFQVGTEGEGISEEYADESRTVGIGVGSVVGLGADAVLDFAV